MCSALQVCKTVFETFMNSRAKGRPIRGFGLEYLNNPAETLSSSYSQSTIRDPAFHVSLSDAVFGHIIHEPHCSRFVSVLLR